MEWKLIETKWEAMTRRIRADYPTDGTKALATPKGEGAPRDELSASLADSRTASTQRPEFKFSSK